MTTKKQWAKWAGICYLFVILFGVFAEKMVRADLIDPQNIDVTIQNISENTLMYKMGIVSDFLMMISFFLLPFLLTQVLKDVNPFLEKLMRAMVVISVSIMCLNMLNAYGGLYLVNYRSVQGFSLNQTENLVAMFLNFHKVGYRIAQIFFGLWLFPLGVLVCKSKLFPRVIGVLLVIASWSFIIDFFLFFLVSDYSNKASSWVTLPTVFGEFALCIWLLVKGVRYIPVVEPKESNHSRVLT